ncbi:DUF6951 family protein [Methanolapillus millepedarum]|uniref:Uncharacterized protein n=1 Tax=Methanolapillus millepedarum TaxID=3028296 RepID=A0AA96VEN8_9EURY|nr:hypothetical protein MsAc7_07780 [Methanosarcinaceae archaeon Ac7]
MATLKMATICGHTNTVTAEAKGMETHVVIETTCPKIKKWGTDFSIPMEDIMDIQNKTLDEKRKACTLTPTCFVPTLVMNTVWMENGMISKSLVKKMGHMDIEYIE